MLLVDRLVEKLPVDGQMPGELEGFAVDQLVEAWGGCSFGQGRFQVVAAKLSVELSEYVAGLFSPLVGPVRVFGCDYAGRLFCAWSTVGGGGTVGVYRVDVERGAVRCVSSSVQGFVEGLSVDFGVLLDEEGYQAWVGQGGGVPVAGQCVGFDTPLALGGSEEWSNRSVTDVAVYVSLTHQVRSQMSGLSMVAR